MLNNKCHSFLHDKMDKEYKIRSTEIFIKTIFHLLKVVLEFVNYLTDVM